MARMLQGDSDRKWTVVRTDDDGDIGPMTQLCKESEKGEQDYQTDSDGLDRTESERIDETANVGDKLAKSKYSTLTYTSDPFILPKSLRKGY